MENVENETENIYVVRKYKYIPSVAIIKYIFIYLKEIIIINVIINK